MRMTSMWKPGGLPWKELFRRTWKQFREDRIFGSISQTLVLFPALDFPAGPPDGRDGAHDFLCAA